jgi:hypothetical protein
MKRGAAVCRFEISFYRPASGPLRQPETPEQIERRNAQQQLANFVLEALPDSDGVTLAELRAVLQQWQLNPNQTRPSVVFEALRHLQHAGLVASSANQPGNDLSNPRYWRAPTTGK